MSLFTQIEKIRARPEVEKKKISLIVSVCITSVIFLIWISLLIFTAPSMPDTTETSNVPSPFAQIGDSFSKIFDKMSEIFKQTDSVSQ